MLLVMHILVNRNLLKWLLMVRLHVMGLWLVVLYCRYRMLLLVLRLLMMMVIVVVVLRELVLLGMILLLIRWIYVVLFRMNMPTFWSGWTETSKVVHTHNSFGVLVSTVRAMTAKTSIIPRTIFLFRAGINV